MTEVLSFNIQAHDNYGNSGDSVLQRAVEKRISYAHPSKHFPLNRCHSSMQFTRTGSTYGHQWSINTSSCAVQWQHKMLSQRQPFVLRTAMSYKDNKQCHARCISINASFHCTCCLQNCSQSRLQPKCGAHTLN